MKRYRITIEGHTFDVEVLGDPRGHEVQVSVDGEILTIGVEAMPLTVDAPVVDPDPPGAASPVLAAAGVDGIVPSPLPGVVKTITVRPGQQVAVDDELLVIEAMKMENIIRATRAGSIGTIYVAEGRQVAYGDPLLEVLDS
jgi:biotin carboxyl carrier protein